MRSILMITLTALSLSAFADNHTIKVKGMHCGACAKSIEDTVCKMEGLKSCSAKLVNAKKKEGELTIERTDGQPVDMAEVKKLIEAAGDYTIAEDKAAKAKKK